MANRILTTTEAVQYVLDLIKKTAKERGVSEVDVANALAGSLFYSSSMKPMPK